MGLALIEKKVIECFFERDFIFETSSITLASFDISLLIIFINITILPYVLIFLRREFYLLFIYLF